ncbi:MAG: response regulator [Desulfovibrio sp.]|nr:response regulator [Desulfovibrio sp.]
MPDKCKIVVVDDNITILEAVRNALKDDYDVYTLTGGLELFRMLAQSPVPPDLILLDVILPLMSGYEILNVLKKDKKAAEVPVIFLTVKDDRESELFGLSQGAVDYVKKPFTPLLLKKRISIHLLLEQQKNELREMNENLNALVGRKTETISRLQTAIISMMGDLAVYRDYADGDRTSRTTRLLAVLTDNLPAGSKYAEAVRRWDLPMFLQSSQLYDIGKINIPDVIRLKPGPLNAGEREEMKKHTIVGAQMIAQLQEEVESNAFLEHAEVMAVSHHEHWNGNGYPLGLKKRQIPLQGRMVAFADVYDALVSKRPYKEPYSHELALDIIRGQRGKQFDPELTDIFLKAMENSPPHSSAYSGT